MPVNTGIVLGGLQQQQQSDPIQKLAAFMQILQAQRQGQLTDLQLQKEQQAMPFHLQKLQAEADKAKRVESFFSPQNMQQFSRPEYAAVEPGPGGMGPSRAEGPRTLDFEKMLNAGAMQGVVDPEKLVDHRAKLEQAKAAREAAMAQRADALQARLYDIETRSQDRQLDREQRAAIALESNRIREEIAQMRGAIAGRPQQATIADPKNPNNTLVVDSTKFNAERYLAGDTTGVIGGGPKLTQTGAAAFKQATQMQGFASDIQQAEDLLMGNKRDQYGNVMPGTKPTGSLIGKGVDVLGGVFGYAVPGAPEAAELKTVSARLVQRVPRFEGPQSDKDVAEYKAAAGQAANEALPRETRLAAIRKMRELYTGYEDGSRGKIVQQQVQGQPQAPRGPTRNDVMTLEDVDATAKASGLSREEVIRRARQKGIRLQ